MPSERVVYRNWIVELGFDPLSGPVPADEITPTEPPDSAEKDERLEAIREEVRKALSRLSADERELIERIHYMGQSYRELSRASGRAVHKLEAMYDRAVRKLRRALAPLVRDLYGIEIQNRNSCPICNSPHRREIDRLIHGRDSEATWRPVIEEIRRRYKLRIRSPQVLIGHENYH